ncbi:hypothetical protein HMPREF1584_00533 [Gardnerella vaginalis JCP8481A]|nr:hypothetical protein HMPREF1584_00533 [Gardnerella vaginalis JCP8481A]EPI43940.1 hypothetical protein HMPREF1585_00289 [Gardnerella vaginalis JCP8481B]
MRCVSVCDVCVSLAKTCATHECFLRLSDSVNADGVYTADSVLCGGS